MRRGGAWGLTVERAILGVIRKVCHLFHLNFISGGEAGDGFESRILEDGRGVMILLLGVWKGVGFT